MQDVSSRDKSSKSREIERRRKSDSRDDRVLQEPFAVMHPGSIVIGHVTSSFFYLYSSLSISLLLLHLSLEGY